MNQANTRTTVGYSNIICTTSGKMYWLDHPHGGYGISLLARSAHSFRHSGWHVGHSAENFEDRTDVFVVNRFFVGVSTGSKLVARSFSAVFGFSLAGGYSQEGERKGSIQSIRHVDYYTSLPTSIRKYRQDVCYTFMYTCILYVFIYLQRPDLISYKVGLESECFASRMCFENFFLNFSIDASLK